MRKETKLPMATTNKNTRVDETRERERGEAPRVRALVTPLKDFGRGLNERLNAISQEYDIQSPRVECRTEISGEALVWRAWMFDRDRLIGERRGSTMERAINEVIEEGVHALAYRHGTGRTEERLQRTGT
jgi:hypothetical protein